MAFDSVLFILSTGRTGTTALAHHLDGFGGKVKAVHEPKPSRNLRIASNRALCGKLTSEQLVTLYKESRKALFAQTGEPVYIESNPFLHGFIDVLDQLVPTPKILHVVRDPRTYVTSYLNFGGISGKKSLATRFIPFWMLKPEKYEPESGLNWRAMTDVEKLAWRWDRINRVLDCGAELYGERYRRVKYEDIFSDLPAGLSEIMNFAGLETKPENFNIDQAPINASVDKRKEGWAEWSGEDRRQLTDICADSMARYGYK